MDEEISYGVFWKNDFTQNEFHLFSGWYKRYEDAYSCYKSLKEGNPFCIEALLVEKCECYEIVASTEAVS